MSANDRSTAGREPLALDALLSEDERRTVSIEEHAAFRESLVNAEAADEIEDLLEVLRRAEFEERGAKL